MTLGVKSPGIIFPKRMVFYGSEGAAYVPDYLARVREIAQDGTFIALGNSVVIDTKTGLEWFAGPDRDTNWYQAKSWVESLSVDGGGWRMPTKAELRTLYKEGAGTCKLFKITGYRVWSGETKGSHETWFFNFYNGYDHWGGRQLSVATQGFAVRSRR